MASDGFDQPSGLADRVDDLLLQVEGWSERSRSAITAVAVVATVALLAWWLTRPAGPDVALDDRIPRAEAATAVTGAGGGSASSAVPTSGSVRADSSSSPTGDAAHEEEPPADLVVHVVGEVARPGLVSVRPGARIADVVDAAGGPLESGNVERLNLAMPAADGMQVRIPAADETGDDAEASEPLVRLAPTVGSTDPAAGSDQGPVDLNRAGPEELATLPGVGPAIAGAIVTWRDDNGGFATVEDLLDVPGIGPAKLAALRDRVVV